MSKGSRSVVGEDRSSRSAAVREWLGDLDSRTAAVLEATSSKTCASLILSHRNHHPEWSASRRAAIEETLHIFRRNRFVLLASSETPLGAYLLRLAHRMLVPTIAVRTPDSERRGRSKLPWIDRALVAIPHRIFVIDIASGSKSLQLIEQRLHDPRFPMGSVFVDVDCGMHSDHIPMLLETKRCKSKMPARSVRDALIDQGAVLQLRQPPWPTRRTNLHSPRSNAVLTSHAHGPPVQLVPILHHHLIQDIDDDHWPFLTHCTRGRQGAWPDQSLEGYWDSLMESNPTLHANGSPWTTLKRIVEQQRLLATSYLKRSSHPSVSFSAVPLRELLGRRRFRPHLGRWDWEPYGLCVRREWIESLGGRPVLYQAPETWEELAPSDQIFFQPGSSSGPNPSGSDETHRWQDEREWRLPCDLRLRELPFDAAFHFVPTQREAKELQLLSRFPIVFLE